jgi:DNA-binding LytR/AlgR family response regulator
VIFLKAEVNYSIVYLLNGKKLMVATPLKTLEARFDAHNFFRTHKSFLINIFYVKTFFAIKSEVEMVDNKRIMVSRRKIDNLKKCLINA